MPPGRYQVTTCVGDSGHEQIGQHVTVEGLPLLQNVTTAAGRYREASITVEVTDGRLTIEIGRPGSTTNTCLNWVVIDPVRSE